LATGKFAGVSIVLSTRAGPVELEALWPHAFSSLYQSIEQGRHGAPSSDFLTLTGREPLWFIDFMEQYGR
jgi:hypothetical protein